MKNKKRLSLSDIDKKLDRLIGLEKKELFEESKLERNEKIFMKEEEEVINQIEKLEHTERNIRKEIGQHPLKKLSYKDAGKSMVGAFVGLLSHFAVLEGVKFAEEITLRRATFLYFVSLLIAIIVFYYTGFRSIKDVKILETKVEKVTQEHRTPWLKQWTLHSVEVSEQRVEEISNNISKSLDTKHQGSWYADFKDSSHHYIIFPSKVFFIDRTSEEQYKEASKYGISLGIPEYQVDFAPNVKKWKR